MLLEAGAAIDIDDRGHHTPLLYCLHLSEHTPSYVIPVLLRYGADIDRARDQTPSDRPPNAYLERVHAAGGWKRHAQAHATRLAPIFAKVFPRARLPPELVAHIVGFWAHVGYY